MKYLLCAWLLIQGTIAMAQSVPSGLQNYYLRLGAYSARPAHPLTFTANQAALAHLPTLSASLFGEKRFLLNDLSFCQMALALPTVSGHFGIQAALAGSAENSNSKLGLAYARRLGEKVSVGAQFNYIHYAIRGYGSAGAVMVEGGVIYNITQNLRSGLHIYNPSRAALGKAAEEKLPMMIASGWGYDVSEHFFINAEIIKEENKPFTVHAGMQYRVVPTVVVKGGVATGTGTFYLGSGFTLQQFVLDVSASFHPQLGITPGIMLTFNRGNQ